MKITMYELLGLVKDGKAPKKIKMRNYIYEYQGDDYMCELNDKEYWLFSDGYIKFNEWLENFLKSEVEILEEENKIPEKLNEDFNQHCNEYLYKKVEDKVNEIIDFLKSKGE